MISRAAISRCRRFIDDAAAAKLLRAAREHPDPFTRLAVEFLARTGLRKGEFLDLTVDSVVQIGSAYWLHVPLGKLRTDRYIPLHPQLKEMLDEWVAERPAGLREPYLFIERGRRIGKQRVGDAVANAAQAAGIGRVTPHQLRHTLATQAINRGMSLEAIAALLGHKSMRMTMVYAKIANRTVADEYFSVSEKVEALYDAPKELPATAEGAEMRKLRAEMHRRMLGNGYCARPVGLDCHFESICESCTYFQTTHEFRPTLQRQRDDAAEKGQVGRLKIFDGLLARLEPRHHDRPRPRLAGSDRPPLVLTVPPATLRVHRSTGGELVRPRTRRARPAAQAARSNAAGRPPRARRGRSRARLPRRSACDEPASSEAR